MKKALRIFLTTALLLIVSVSILTLSSCEDIFCSHAESEWIIDIEPDFHNDGLQHTVCEKCGKTLRTYVTPALICEHESTVWSVEKETSETEAGIRNETCRICSDILNTEEIPRIELSLEEVKEIIAPSVVKVLCYDYSGMQISSQGSGFFIDSIGTFVTNAHVVKNAYYVKIEDYTGAIYNAEIMFAYDGESSDYAILRATDCVSSAVSFEESFGTGDAVYAFGFPNDASTLQSSSGNILRTNVVYNNTVHYLENTAVIDNGSSGGALVNSFGKVIGITTGQLANTNYVSIAYKDIKELVSATLTGGKSPMDWFHDEINVEFTTTTLEDYFDVFVNAESLGGTKVGYSVSLKLKPRYSDGSFEFKSGSVYVIVTIKTNYTWLESDSEKSDYTVSTIEFDFSTKEKLISGITSNIDTSIDISSHSGLGITYEISYTSVSGALTFYN